MKKSIFTLSAALIFTLTACQGTSMTEKTEKSEEPIKIGYLGPLTGDAVSYGMDTLNGVKLKAEEINARGGIAGRMIELVPEDARCTGSDAASAAQKLIHIDKVVAIIGGQCSGETLAAAPIANAASIVMISPLSSSPDVTEAGDFIFRDYPSDALKTEAMAAYFKEKGFEKVAVITENTDFAVAFRDALKVHLGEDSLVFDEVVEPNTKDYRTLITRLTDMEFDVFFPNGQSSGTIGAMLQQLREQGLTQPAVSHDAAQDDTLIEIAREASNGMQAISVPAVSVDSPFGIAFNGKYGKAQASLAFAAHAYDALGVLAEAIEKAGTGDSGIRDYLYALTGYEGTVGTFSFDENGDVIGIPYVLYEVQKGKWVTIQDIAVN